MRSMRSSDMSSGFGRSISAPISSAICVFFGLVDLDLGLVDSIIRSRRIIGRLGFVGDLAQRHDRVLVVVAVDGQRAAGGDFARTMGGQHHQVEPVRNLVNAIFDRHAGHGHL
jgi:hypothetical protein